MVVVVVDKRVAEADTMITVSNRFQLLVFHTLLLILLTPVISFYSAMWMELKHGT